MCVFRSENHRVVIVLGPDCMQRWTTSCYSCWGGSRFIPSLFCLFSLNIILHHLHLRTEHCSPPELKMIVGSLRDVIFNEPCDAGR